MGIKNDSFKLLATGAIALGALTGLLASATASAALVTGNATITINNPAITGLAGPGAWIFQTHWGASDSTLAIDGATPGGADLSIFGNTALLFPVNTNTTTQYTASTNRSLQATTMDASNTSAAAGTQIGLNGALRLRAFNGTEFTPGTPYLAAYDLSLIKTGGEWIVRSYDVGFDYLGLFKLGNVSESLNSNGELQLNGDLLWAFGPRGWGTYIANPGNPNAIIGSFSLAPSAVPVPAAIWMFGTGVLGLFGITCRKQALAV
ncbi:MAG: hypothetical protein ABL903_18165 [Methylococcales bacterium]